MDPLHVFNFPFWPAVLRNYVQSLQDPRIVAMHFRSFRMPRNVLK